MMWGKILFCGGWPRCRSREQPISAPHRRKVNPRYERGAMIVTSNRGFAEWGDVFGHPVVATAMLDSLLHHASSSI